MDSELHYLTYDAEEMWEAMQMAYVDAGGDILYPGDEKEMLLRGVQSILMLSFAGIDNALRMDTLRYAVREYLDIYGEKRNCYRIRATAATAKAAIVFRATGETKTISAGTLVTADGQVLYRTAEDITVTGLAETIEANITCTQTGAVGNGLVSGAEMQFLMPEDAAESIVCSESASGGQNEEDDETYRERIRTYGLSAVTTGPKEQYRSTAMEVSSEIIDANPVNGGGGIVNVYLLPASDTGTEALIAAVTAALTPNDERPLTDSVVVQLATKKEYTLNVQYVTDGLANASANISAAVAEYQEWQDRTIGRAFNPDRLKALLYRAGCSLVVFGSGSEFDGGAAEYTEIAENEYCKGTITLAVMST